MSKCEAIYIILCKPEFNNDYVQCFTWITNLESRNITAHHTYSCHSQSNKNGITVCY